MEHWVLKFSVCFLVLHALPSCQPSPLPSPDHRPSPSYGPPARPCNHESSNVIASQQQQQQLVSSGSLQIPAIQQISVVGQASSNKPYDGPLLTREEAEKLHADAIAKLNALIALGAQIAAAGPATGSQLQQSSASISGQVSSAQSSGTTYSQQISSQQVPLSVAAVSANQQQIAYTGPRVTKEETEQLHAEAIAILNQLIAQQDAINAAGPATGNDDDVQVGLQQSSSVQASSGLISSQSLASSISSQSVASSITRPAASSITSILVGGGADESKKYTGPIVSKEETEALQAEAIRVLQTLIAQQDAINAAGPATAEDEQQQYQSANNGIASYDTLLVAAAPVVQTSSNIQTISSAALQQSAGQSSSSSVSSTYTGPKVTREETERLHADAIALQKELLAILQRIVDAGPDTSQGIDEPSRLSIEAELQLLAQQSAEVQQQIQVAKAQGENARRQGEEAAAAAELESSDGASGTAVVTQYLPQNAATGTLVLQQIPGPQVSYEVPQVGGGYYR